MIKPGKASRCYLHKEQYIYIYTYTHTHLLQESIYFTNFN